MLFDALWIGADLGQALLERVIIQRVGPFFLREDAVVVRQFVDQLLDQIVDHFVDQFIKRFVPLKVVVVKGCDSSGLE